MAGEKKQSTAIKEIRSILDRGGKWDDSKRTEDEIMKDAKILPVVVTNCEDVTTKTLRQGTAMADDAFTVFDTAYRKMISREYEVEARVKTHVSTLKDKANQVAEALGRINKMAGVDFEEKLSRLERFAAAVDTLDRLNRTGKLSEVASALKGIAP